MHIDVNGATYRLETTGSGNGTHFLYLPSIIGETRNIEIVNELASSVPGSKVTVLEYPGCGASISSTSAWKTIYDIVYDIGRILDGITDRPIVLIGPSIGGWLAAEVAAWYPDKVCALVLSNAFGLRLPEFPAWSPFHETGSADLNSSFYARANPNRLDLGKIIEPSIREEEKEDAYGLFLHLLRVQTLASRIGFNPLMHDPRLEMRLRNIQCPTLIFWGQADGVLAPQYGQAFATQIPGAQLVLDSTSGHFPLLEKPAKHAQAIATMISSLGARS
jgi:pimeloyl-ACP methyl ester carboxylesterase